MGDATDRAGMSAPPAAARELGRAANGREPRLDPLRNRVERVTVHGDGHARIAATRSVIDSACQDRECLRDRVPPARSACGRGVCPDRSTPPRSGGECRGERRRRGAGRCMAADARVAVPAVGEYSRRPSPPCYRSTPPGQRSATKSSVGSRTGGRTCEPAVVVTPCSPRRVRPQTHKTSRQCFPCKKLPTRRTPSSQLLAFCLAVAGRQKPTPAVGASR